MTWDFFVPTNPMTYAHNDYPYSAYSHISPTVYIKPNVVEFKHAERLTFETEVAHIIDPDKIDGSALVKAGIKKQPDLLYVQFILAHEGTNSNGDHFTKEGLEAAAESVNMKLLDWEHGDQVIGHIYSSVFVDPKSDTSTTASDDNRAYIICEAVVYKYKFPDVAKEMVARHDRGELTFSMEAYCSSFECTMCGEEFTAEEVEGNKVCDHLNRARTIGSPVVGRTLKNFFFSGAGTVNQPADRDALALLVANKSKEDSMEKEKIYTEEDLQEAVKAAKAEVDNKGKDEQLKSLQDEVASLTATVNDATAKVTQLTEERDSVKQELASLKNELEVAARRDERVNQLTAIGWELPSDEAEAETALSSIVAMDDSVFNFYLASMKSTIKTEKVETPETPVVASRFPVSGGTKKSGSPTNAERLAALFADAPIQR